MSDGMIGHGTVLTIGGVTIGNIINISGPDQTRASVDISTMDSPAKWMEFIPGLIDGGEVTFEVNYDGTLDGNAEALQAALIAARGVLVITIQDMDGVGVKESSFTCDLAFVTGVGTQNPHEDKITQSVTVKMSGPIVFDDQDS